MTSDAPEASGAVLEVRDLLRRIGQTRPTDGDGIWALSEQVERHFEALAARAGRPRRPAPGDGGVSFLELLFALLVVAVWKLLQ